MKNKKKMNRREKSERRRIILSHNSTWFCSRTHLQSMSSIRLLQCPQVIRSSNPTESTALTSAATGAHVGEQAFMCEGLTPASESRTMSCTFFFVHIAGFHQTDGRIYDDIPLAQIRSHIYGSLRLLGFTIGPQYDTEEPRYGIGTVTRFRGNGSGNWLLSCGKLQLVLLCTAMATGVRVICGNVLNTEYRDFTVVKMRGIFAQEASQTFCVILTKSQWEILHRY